MTNPQEKRTMTKAREIAEELFLTRSMFHDNRIGQDIIVSKIAQKIAAALERACAEAYAKGKVDGMEVKALMGKGLNDAFFDGQAVMRERAAKKVNDIMPTNAQAVYLAECIRALPLEERE